MAETMKILGQSALSALTLTKIYVVPALTSAVLSTILVCNRGNVEITFRISVAVAGAADEQKQYIYYDVPVAAKDTFSATIGLTLATTDEVRAYAGNGNLTVNIFGTEITA